jgi:hypothetical protein
VFATVSGFTSSALLDLPRAGSVPAFLEDPELILASLLSCAHVAILELEIAELE